MLQKADLGCKKIGSSAVFNVGRSSIPQGCTCAFCWRVISSDTPPKYYVEVLIVHILTLRAYYKRFYFIPVDRCKCMQLYNYSTLMDGKYCHAISSLMKYNYHIWKYSIRVTKDASREIRTPDPCFTRAVLCHWAIEANLSAEVKLSHQQCMLLACGNV